MVWRYSTWQKPHARVQRSPLIMKVAVPSAQHSKMFGQPASSQTVTSPRPRTVLRSDRNSVPMLAFARNQAGLRAPSARPAAGSTPAWASRPSRRTGWAGRRRAAPAAGPAHPAAERPAVRSAVETAVATGPVPGHAASWRSTGLPFPQRSAATAKMASTTSAMPTASPSAWSEVTSLSEIPQGTMWSNMARSVLTLRAKPCMVRRRLWRAPMAQILRGRGPCRPAQTPG